MGTTTGRRLRAGRTVEAAQTCLRASASTTPEKRVNQRAPKRSQASALFISVRLLIGGR